MLTAVQTMKINRLLSSCGDENVKLCVLRKTCMKLNLFSSNNEAWDDNYKAWENHRDVDWDNHRDHDDDDDDHNDHDNWDNHEDNDFS